MGIFGFFKMRFLNGLDVLELVIYMVGVGVKCVEVSLFILFLLGRELVF